MRWVVRIALAIVALIVLGIIAVVGVLHTDFGRERVRRVVESNLAAVFTGGATVGKLEGSPFGELVVRDVVIRGADRQPAIRVGTLRIEVSLLGLLAHRVRLGKVIADDIDVAIDRDISELAKPRPKNTTSWTVDLPHVELTRAHVRIASMPPQVGVVDLDDVAIAGALHFGPDRRDARISIHARWRERAQPIAITLDVRDDVEHTAVKLLDAHVGAVTVGAQDVQLVKRAGELAGVRGSVQVAASRAAVAQLVPTFDLPADIVLALHAGSADQSRTAIALTGALGATLIAAQANVDLAREHVLGTASTGELDLAALSHGRIDASVGATIAFDIARGARGDLPFAHVTMSGYARLATAPRTDVAVALDTGGQRAVVELTTTGAIQATVTGAITRARDALSLERAKIIVKTSDLGAVTGGKAPVRGALAVDLSAHGALAPYPDLAVAGAITGEQLRVRDLAVGALHAQIDGARLPSRPVGTAHVRLGNVARGDMRLGEVTLDAANRRDGKIDVTVGSHAEHSPWLVELAALITPPGTGDTTTIAIARHRVRSGDGSEWAGSTGQITIDPRRIEVRGLRSASGNGALALDASYTRAGAGDLTAKLDATGIALGAIRPEALGVLGAHVDVARRSGRWAGKLELTGSGIALDHGSPALDVHGVVEARSEHVTVTASASWATVGSAQLALAVAAPANLEDVAAWRARGHEAIERAQLTVHALDLGRAAALLGVPGKIGGVVDGDLAIAPTATGTLHVHALQLAALDLPHGTDLELSLAPHDGSLAPTLDLRAPGIGEVKAQCELAVPARPFEPRAWQQLPLDAVRSASLHAHDLAFDPGVLARFHIVSKLRGRASVDIEVGSGLSTARATIDVANLRGSPFAKPVDVHVESAVDAQTAHATVTLSANKHLVTTAKLDGRLALATALLARLHQDPRGLNALPLSATFTLDPTSAPQLLEMLGRSSITGGTLTANATVGGTVGSPQLEAHIVGDKLVAASGAGKPVDTVQTVAIDAMWGDAGAKLTVSGTETGGGNLAIVAQGNPAQLAAARVQVTATKLDVTPVLAFVPGQIGGATGTLDAKLAITGLDPQTARIAGELHLRDARVPVASEVGSLRDATIDVTFGQHDITVHGVGKLGSGTVNADGSIALDGASLTGGQAKLTLRKVSPIGTVEPVIDADVTAKLARNGPTWTADVVVDRGNVVVPSRNGEKLKPVGIPNDVAIGAAPPPHAPGTHAPGPPAQPVIVVNITLHSTHVQSDELRTLISGKLKVTADANALGIVGSVTAERGDLDLFGRRYQVDRAAVHFDGSDDPLLDIEIAYDFPDVTTITKIGGRLSKPEITMSSNPANYTQSQLLGFLMGGQPGGDAPNSSVSQKLTDTSTTVVAGQISGVVRKALPFDLDVIRYEAADASSSAAITVGSWITRTLFLAYRQHLDARPDENTGEATVQYWLTHRLEIEGTVGDRGYNGLDVLWRKRY